ncbi:hypothetical protein P168DRAFT_250930 [Aspergillus campestris IBT 28561]|uniref:Fungal-type protein kinase domain-containing protein n=1 Tax=Aspergillus campestris (strain IBT 28561) TaxID=1392248 RepID=A0A2I1D7S4_ASPC2|nr:uncharacterized protein P168DRAFT_250930 [Aspergillus campestris IBT 28561]PKY05935.1 hypothetical protein P168DRAFT_250930 [Aspergillus campestris IBT 28561]
MAQLSRAEAIEQKPIGEGLVSFRDDLTSVCEGLGLPCSVESIRKLDPEARQDLSIHLILALQTLPTSRLLPPISGRKNLFSDLSRLSSSINADEFDFQRLVPLLGAILDRESDGVIWERVYAAAAESTPPPRPPPYLGQTPHSHSTSAVSNSHEHRNDIDAVLREELGSIYTDVPGFDGAYFAVEGLEEAAAAVFRRLQEGDDPVFVDKTGWQGWPEPAEEKQVLAWLITMVDKINGIATEEAFTTNDCRSILGWPHQPLQGSIAARKLDVGFVRSSQMTGDQTHWSHILVMGELKRSPKMDTTSSTWLDLGRYAREVFAAQDTRRFVLGFTLCGPVMRLWEFDRVGATSSTPFDINTEGARFVMSMLAFLRMNNEELGYDPSIISTSDGTRFIEITRDGQPERLFLDGLMRGASCIVGRATTCWKAHREDESDKPLVVKDSWQYPEREDEGELLREAAEKQVINVARYYYHGTVQIHGKDDDIQGAVRKGLDLKHARRHHQDHSNTTPNTAAESAKTGRSTSSAGRKRTSSHLSPAEPPTKRTCSTSPARSEHDPEENRVHRRIIVRDYGVPIYKAMSRVAMLSAFAECIEGYESLHRKAGFLQGDISTGNLILNKDGGKHSWPAFLIDLDLAIKEQREQPSGARGKTGTRAFMAIGLLLGEKHSFMHDLESFFWVILWICIHHDGPSVSKVVRRFERWNYVDLEELAELKKGAVAHEGDFIRMTDEHFSDFYKPLGPWVNRLRKMVFPNGGRWEEENKGLYSQMKTMLKDACKDPGVLTQ